MRKTLAKAFKITLPVLFGYLVLGMAFGLLVQEAGYNFIWALFIGIIVYAGSMQFVLVSFLKSGLELVSVALTTLSVNSRHIFYGISFLEEFKAMGKRRWYMMFSLTDETYSLLCSIKNEKYENKKDLMFCVALLDHLYWIIGGTLGALLGEFLPISREGVEFSMTALFLVIMIDQWKSYKSHIPAYVGAVCGGLSLLVLGSSRFILPALVATSALLLIFRKTVSKRVVEEVDCNAD